MLLSQRLKTDRRELRYLMHSQGDLRMQDLHAFASVADTRASIIISVAAALAAAAAGLFAATLDKGPNYPVMLGSLTAVVLFGLCAKRGLHSARRRLFHPRGHPPSAFEPDVLADKPLADIYAEMAEDLDERLAFNTAILRERDDELEKAITLMWRTPFAASAAAIIGWVIPALWPK